MTIEQSSCSSQDKAPNKLFCLISVQWNDTNYINDTQYIPQHCTEKKRNISINMQVGNCILQMLSGYNFSLAYSVLHNKLSYFQRRLPSN